MNYYLYILRCVDDSLYTGITTNLDRRLAEHNESPKKGAKYTRTKKPCILVYTEEYPDRSRATKREQEIKKWSRARKDALISKSGPRTELQKDTKTRCEWAGTDPQYVAYHDQEWGVPVHDDRILFEFLILEGAQAGLSWSTVLKKRAHYKGVFDQFDPQKVARYTNKKVTELLADSGIIRNRLKIAAAIQNAKAFLVVQKEFGTFDSYIWQFVGGSPIKSSFLSIKDYPVKTKEAERMSGDLLKRGFKFVGPTICYAFMQAVGLVNDHQIQCFRHDEVG